jgi:hypothetical protein
MFLGRAPFLAVRGRAMRYSLWSVLCTTPRGVYLLSLTQGAVAHSPIFGFWDFAIGCFGAYKQQKHEQQMAVALLFVLKWYVQNTIPPMCWLGEGCNAYYFKRFSSDTVSLWRPFARRDANTRRPFLVLIRLRNPCLLARLRREG